MYESEPQCSLTAMDQVVTDMGGTLDEMREGTIKASWQSLLPYTTSDAWFQ